MTNKEKFKEIFGIEPDCGRCNPYPCEEKDCKYWEQCEDQPGCACDDWWDWEFEEPTTKNDLVVDCISRQAVIDAINANCIWENEYNLTSSRIKKAVENLPSVTLLSSELDKNSKKLEKDFGELDCISRADALVLYCDKCGVYNCISKCSSVSPQSQVPSNTTTVMR